MGDRTSDLRWRGTPVGIGPNDETLRNDGMGLDF